VTKGVGQTLCDVPVILGPARVGFEALKITLVSGVSGRLCFWGRDQICSRGILVFQ